jgi:hypothetical protein
MSREDYLIITLPNTTTKDQLVNIEYHPIRKKLSDISVRKKKNAQAKEHPAGERNIAKLTHLLFFT